MPRLQRLVANLCEKIADSFGGKALYIDAEAGELRIQIAGVVMVIDAEDGKVPRDGNGACFEGLTHLGCQHLVADNDGGGTLRSGKVHTETFRGRIGGKDPGRIHRQLLLPHCRHEVVQSEVVGQGGGVVDQKTDLPVAEPGQLAARVPDALFVGISDR